MNEWMNEKSLLKDQAQHTCDFTDNKKLSQLPVILCTKKLY